MPVRLAGRLSLASAVLLCAVVLAGCTTTPPPAAGPGGFVTVELVRAPAEGTAFFEPIHRAEVIDEDGAVVAAWRVTNGAAPVEIPPGRYRLRVFTVFLGDTLECVADPGAPGGSRCVQPTLGPGQVCPLDIVVVAKAETLARFHVLRDGACGIEAGSAPAG
jgi:hypothetical protein